MKYQPPFVPGATPGAAGIYNADPDAVYVNGNPATGQEGSYFPAEAIEHGQRELVKIITSLGLSPSHTVLEQVAEGIARYASLAQYGTVSGTANALTVSKIGSLVVPKALFTGMRLICKPAAINTGAVTADVFGLGAKAVRSYLDAALAGGELLPGRQVEMLYSTAGNGGAGAWLLQPWAKENSFNFSSQAYVTAGTYTFTVPDQVTRLKGRVWGAGGGGGGASPTGFGASGGNGGGYAEGYIPVTPGQSITVTVGAGGAGGYGAVNGSNGGTSSIGAYLTATGGQGGNYGNATAPGYTANTPGQGGGSHSIITLYGARGGQGGGPANGFGAVGGFGGAAPMGGGGAPGTTADGNSGQAPGAGGAGGGGYTGLYTTGGNGAVGGCLIEWGNV